MVGGRVIEELWATRFIILIGSKRVTHSIMLVCGGCDNRKGSTKQWWPQMACEDPCTNDHTGGSRCSYTRKRCEGISLVHLNVPSHSQRKPEVGLMAGNSLITLVRLIKRVGSSHHICRDIEGVGKWSLEVYNTIPEAHHVYELVKLRGPEVTPKKCSVLSKCVRYDLNKSNPFGKTNTVM